MNRLSSCCDHLGSAELSVNAFGFAGQVVFCHMLLFTAGNHTEVGSAEGYKGISWESGNVRHLHVGSTHTGPQGNQPGGHLPARNKGQLVMRGQRRAWPTQVPHHWKAAVTAPLSSSSSPESFLPQDPLPLCGVGSSWWSCIFFLPFARG